MTSRGLFILGKLASRFVNGEAMEGVTTEVMPLPMEAIDMNLAWRRWLLVVLANEVRRFDLDLIHEFVSKRIAHIEIMEWQSVGAPMESEWRDINSTTGPLALAS